MQHSLEWTMHCSTILSNRADPETRSRDCSGNVNMSSQVLNTSLSISVSKALLLHVSKRSCKYHLNRSMGQDNLHQLEVWPTYLMQGNSHDFFPAALTKISPTLLWELSRHWDINHRKLSGNPQPGIKHMFNKWFFRKKWKERGGGRRKEKVCSCEIIRVQPYKWWVSVILCFNKMKKNMFLKLLSLVFPANRYSFIGLWVTPSAWAFLQPVGPQQWLESRKSLLLASCAPNYLTQPCL